MSLDVIQLLYYAGFALLGWWLRHQGIALPSTKPAPVPSPAGPIDQRALIEFLKSLLDRLAVPNASSPSPSANVVHVPIEVATSVKQG